jgi:cobalt-zinc-cadmium efflux system membrane fusion protein
MKPITKLAGAALALAAAGYAWHAGVGPHPAAAHAAEAPARPRAAPGLIAFAPDDPQLSFLRVGLVASEPLPVADPVAGRIAYDENRTSRIASPVAGRVIVQHVEVGDSVRAGQLLAELDSPDLAAAQADERKASADEERKRLALARTRVLVEADVVARKDLEEAEADYRQADAEARRARQRTASLHTHGDVDGRFGLRAPIAGVVADKQVNPGQEVRPDQPNPLFVVSDLRHVWAIADVPEQLAARLRQGQGVLVETDAYPEQPFRGTVERIGVAVDPATRRVQVRCALYNADGRLKPDMFARIGFVAGDRESAAVPVPNTALVTEGLYTYVFVERAPGQFVRQRVHVALGGAGRSWIDEGLNDRERIVTEGALLLQAEAAHHAG